MLAAGQRVGPYLVTGPLGVGGMGEVYRARDTRLGRDVALKVLRADFAADHERMARFEREARVLASLNHSNIAATYGLEDSNNTCVLVLELVEGPTLADRICRGPMPADEALPIAKQIAEGLEYAHEHGVIHRDLKPGNVKIPPDCPVKVLDFGLAKALQPEIETDLNQSPTVSTMATRAGILLGTPAFMAPEQVRAKPADRRLDIWAFGCVLFEMLTGKPAFSGETLSDVLSAVLQREPDWSLLPEATPPSVRLLLRRCLRKDMKQRLHHISDARIEIEDALLQMSEEGPTRTRTPTAYGKLSWPLGALALLAIGYGISVLMPRNPPQTHAPTQLSIVLPWDHRLNPDLFLSSSIAFSPDGSRIVYVGNSTSDFNRGSRLYIRALNEFKADLLAGTDEASTPFFSPDGQWVGFFARGKLWKVPIGGGAPVAICDAARVGTGATWGPDDTIIFTVFGSGLLRVSAQGGQPEGLTTPDPKRGEVGHQWPQFLPNGKGVLFAVVTSREGRIDVLLFGQGDRHVVLEGSEAARYVPTGHLIYEGHGGLWATSFDLDQLKVGGRAARIVDGARRQFAISDNGSLVYASLRDEKSSLLWVDRKGTSEPIADAPGWYDAPRLSPDGRHVAVTVGDEAAKRTIWLLDLNTNARAPLTQAGTNSTPVWSPDGSRIAFAATGSGSVDIYSKAANGSGEPELLLAKDLPQYPGSWSPDGQRLVFWEVDPNGLADLWMLSMTSGRPSPLIATPFNESWPDISPSGDWLAYLSDESGRDEVYVVAFPHGNQRLRVSVDGGGYPIWSADGKELFYRQPGGHTMVVAVTTKPKLTVSHPQRLFSGRFIGPFDVSPDGRRFVMTQRAGDSQSTLAELRVVLNWFELLRQQVPAASN